MKKISICTGIIIGTRIAGEATVEVELKVSVTILVIGTEVADIGAEVGLEAEAVVKVLVIVENVEEANMMMMRDGDEAGLMEGISLTNHTSEFHYVLLF